MQFASKTVLFLGAHPDDIELGCGALIHQISPKSNVHCVTLSDNQKNPDLRGLITEQAAAMRRLGVPSANTRYGAFETRIFHEARQAILEYFLRLRTELRPDLIFVHSNHDVHQDHTTMTDEALRAFRGITVLAFDVVRSSYGFFPHFFAEVSEADVQAKIDALKCYTTYRERYYFSPELTRAIIVRNGALAEKPFAEGFEILRVVGSFAS